MYADYLIKAPRVAVSSDPLFKALGSILGTAADTADILIKKILTGNVTMWTDY